MKQSFAAAPLDSYAQQITNGIAMLGGAILLPVLFLYLSGLLFFTIGWFGPLIAVALALSLMVWLLLNYAVQPVTYEVGAESLTIRRRWSRAVVVTYDKVVAVSLANALSDTPRSGMRRSFNAGVFGYQGRFQLAPYGTVVFLATNRQRLVALARSTTDPLIISPERPSEFVEALRTALIRRADDDREA